MRNLKKILALVLALMMVLSVMVTASAASYDDDAAIDHKEAVEVLTAAGVLNGDGTGNFQPDAVLNRASAAVLVSNVLLGGDIDLVEKTATGYKDVPATHWASGYVALCSDLKVISGDGAGSFFPDVTLDGYSFAKMLLVAAYPGEYIDAETGNVKFGGNSWKVQVAIALKSHPELLAGLNLTLSEGLTREKAAQMIYNVMCASGEIGDLKKVGTTTDSFGRPSTNVWINTKTGAEVYSEPVGLVAKYTAKTTDEVIEKDLGIEDLKNNATANGTLVEYYLKAVAADGTKSYTRIVVPYTVATIGIGEADEKTGDVTYTLGSGKYYDFADNTKKADTVVLHGDIADKAVVTYAVDNNKVAHVYPTTAKAGTLNARNSASGTITIDTTKYTLSESTGAANLSVYNFEIENFSVQLDQYGYVVALTPSVETKPADPTVITDYVYVLDYQAQAYVPAVAPKYDVFGNLTNGDDVTEGKDPMVVATVLTIDGDMLTVTLTLDAVKNDKGEITGYTYNIPGKTELTKNVELTKVGAWLAYEITEDGTYTLSALDSKYATTRETFSINNSGKSYQVTLASGTKYVNSATVTTGYTLNEKGDAYVMDSYVGLPGKTAVTTFSEVDILITADPEANTISNIYVVGAAVTTEIPEEPTPTAPTYAYAVELGDQVVNGYMWTVYASGVENTIVVSSGDYTKGGVYIVSVYNGEDEKYEGTYVMTPVEMSEGAEVTLTDSTFFMTGAGNYNYYGKDAVVYNATTGAADTIEVGDTVIWNADYTLIYIVKEAKAD